MVSLNERRILTTWHMVAILKIIGWSLETCHAFSEQELPKYKRDMHKSTWNKTWQIHLMHNAEFSSIMFYFLHFLQNRKKDNSTPEAHRKRANSYVNFEGMPMQVSEISSIGIFCPKFVLYGRKHWGLGGSNQSKVWPQVFKGWIGVDRTFRERKRSKTNI